MVMRFIWSSTMGFITYLIIMTHLSYRQPEGFSTKEIREAFLRFFVALLQDYRAFLDETGFRAAEFIQSLNLVQCSADFCGELVKTQLFQRFLEERQEVNDAEVRFFDESIKAKINRSRRNALLNFGRADSKQTTFLDDTSWTVSRSYALAGAISLSFIC